MTDSQSADAAQPITQIDFARAGVVTPQMAAVAAAEGREPEDIRAAVATGRIAIPANIHHASLAPAGVGSTLEGVPLSTKVNVNLGISGDLADEALEWEKVDVALELGADAIMDLSNSGKTRAFRRALVEKSPAMIGTVPMYDAIGYLEKALIAITPEDFLEVVRAHAEDGVDFVTIHAGMNRRVIESFKETGRLTNIVSRGGSLIFAWMEATGARHLARARCVHLHWGRHASRQRLRCHGRRADRRAHRNWQADAPRLGRRSAGDGGRPRAYGAR